MGGQEIVCGLKATHDGALAVFEGERLLFSVEAEKLGNRPRHSRLAEMSDVVALLAAHGLEAGDLDRVAVDGWVQSGDGRNAVEVVHDGPHLLDVAGYTVLGSPEQPLDALVRTAGSRLPIGEKTFEYSSYTHATGHAMASYCTSPFAKTGEPALVLVWDGGMPATVFRFDPDSASLRSYGAVLPVAGSLYPIFASLFDPFKVSGKQRRDKGDFGDFAQLEALLPVSGKAMAYAALAEPDERAVETMIEHTVKAGPIGVAGAFVWSHRVRSALAPLGLPDAAVLASFQEHLFRLLLRGLRDGPVARMVADGLPLCLSGGCALNIKWNAQLRESGVFSAVWVPPFPNDAGSAIGAACAELVRTTGNPAVQWSVFSGPDAGPVSGPEPGWRERECPIEDLARLLHQTGEPVVIVSGRAELGPRALGHRSIVAPAAPAAMRDRLNEIKLRETYRPVAPICLEAHAPEIFDPGVPDPYMLFEHQVRPQWRERVAAVVHADNSARLQTVSPEHPLLYRLLTAYHALSGVPVLCNTSANHPGSGFFPDAASAMRWGGTRYVWCRDRLYHRPDAPVPDAR